MPNHRIRNFLSGCPSERTSTLTDSPLNFREFAIGIDPKLFQDHIKTAYDGIRTANIEHLFLQKIVLSSEGEPTTSRPLNVYVRLKCLSINALDPGIIIQILNRAPCKRNERSGMRWLKAIIWKLGGIKKRIK